MANKLSAREHTVRILDKFDRSSNRLSAIFENYFASNETSFKSRPEITHLVQNIIRHRGYIDHIIISLFRGNYKTADNTLRNILRLGTYEILYRDQVPDFAAVNEAVELAKRRRGKGAAGLGNALLRKIRKADTSVEKALSPETPIHQMAALLSHPGWMISRWIDSLGWERTIQFCEWNNTVPILTVRMNSLQTEKEAFEKFLEESMVQWEPNQIIPEFYTVHRVSKIRSSSQFNEGHFSFQDVSSGLVTNLLKPTEGDSVLDVCAAPGGKCGYMAELMRNSGSVYAFDVDADRHALLKESMKRLKLNSVNVEQKDATADSFQVSDKILIDAPCTGTGVMAKRADLKWRRHPSDLDEMVAVQKRIISHIAQFLESEGELVYATCSVEPEENWGVVDSFLADNPSFSVQSAEGRVPSGFLDNMGALSTFPPEHGMDGVFAVILRRN